jgi:Domain of unknown function (DUF1905)
MTFKTTIVRDGSMCFIPITFDSKAIVGKVRVPVKVTLNGYTFQSTKSIEGAKKPETRTRRIEAAVREIRVRPAGKR